jgi:hypothetical protein
MVKKETSEFIKVRDFLDQMSNCQLPKDIEL